MSTSAASCRTAVPLLEIDSVSSFYGDFQALFDVDVNVAEGERVAIIGANGAGKSTLLASVAGLLKPASGEVRFDGKAIGQLPAHRRLAAGIALVPEGRRIFPSLTVEENLRMGAYRRRSGPWRLRTVYEVFPALAELSARSGGTLSGGEQQMCAIGRALMSNPRVILLDELSLGLAPKVIEAIYETIHVISREGTTVVLVEQDIGQALAVADRAYCLLEGRISLQGPTRELTRERVVEAYFGM
jgi:branched-chain amino acid transport system ATP-binding protein